MVAQRVRTGTYRPIVIIDVALAHQTDKIYHRHTLVHKRKRAYPRCLYEGWYGAIMSHITIHILHSVFILTYILSAPQRGRGWVVLDAFSRLPLTGIESLTDQPVANCYIDYTTPAPSWCGILAQIPPLRDVREQHKKCALKLIRTYLRESNRGHQGVLCRISPKFITIVDHSTCDSKKKVSSSVASGS